MSVKIVKNPILQNIGTTVSLSAEYSIYTHLCNVYTSTCMHACTYAHTHTSQDLLAERSVLPPLV